MKKIIVFIVSFFLISCGKNDQEGIQKNYYPKKKIAVVLLADKTSSALYNGIWFRSDIEVLVSYARKIEIVYVTETSLQNPIIVNCPSLPESLPNSSNAYINERNKAKSRVNIENFEIFKRRAADSLYTCLHFQKDTTFSDVAAAVQLSSDVLNSLKGYDLLFIISSDLNHNPSHGSKKLLPFVDFPKACRTMFIRPSLSKAQLAKLFNREPENIEVFTSSTDLVEQLISSQ